MMGEYEDWTDGPNGTEPDSVRFSEPDDTDDAPDWDEYTLTPDMRAFVLTHPTITIRAFDGWLELHSPPHAMSVGPNA